MPGSFFKQDDNGHTDYKRINPDLINFPLYELVEKIIKIFVSGEKPDAYLLRFKDAVLEFEQKKSSDITGFLRWWEDNRDKVSIIVPEEENAIRIMTIHKAKGLQSPVIIIPYANWAMGLEGNKDHIWVSNEGEKPFGRSPFLVRAVKNLENTLFEKDYHEESVLTNLDNLNLLYVAFTRPVDRLYVIPECGDKKDTAESLIKETILSVPELYSKYNAAEGKFETGTKGTYSKKGKDLLTRPLEIKGYKSADIHSKVVILPKHRTLELVEPVSGRAQVTIKAKRGIVLHAVLSGIKTIGDIDDAITLVQVKGFITGEDKDKIRKEISEILELGEVKPWFTGDWEVKTEAEILLPDGRIFRPDRVMIKGDKAIVIDYKTGAPKPQDSQQLNDYAGSFIEAGYKSVGKYILYIENRKVVRL
jgi:ATP-dependent exoDNAse (exonuclease V) beta subunit